MSFTRPLPDLVLLAERRSARCAPPALVMRTDSDALGYLRLLAQSLDLAKHDQVGCVRLSCTLVAQLAANLRAADDILRRGRKRSRGEVGVPW